MPLLSMYAGMPRSFTGSKLGKSAAEPPWSNPNDRVRPRETVSSVVGLFPVAIVAWSVTWITYIWMLAQELDLDLQDALVIAVISGGASLLSYALIIAPIARAMGLSI